MPLLTETPIDIGHCSNQMTTDEIGLSSLGSEIRRIRDDEQIYQHQRVEDQSHRVEEQHLHRDEHQPLGRQDDFSHLRQDWMNSVFSLAERQQCEQRELTNLRGKLVLVTDECSKAKEEIVKLRSQVEELQQNLRVRVVEQKRGKEDIKGLQHLLTQERDDAAKKIDAANEERDRANAEINALRQKMNRMKHHFESNPWPPPPHYQHPPPPHLPHYNGYCPPPPQNRVWPPPPGPRGRQDRGKRVVEGIKVVVSNKKVKKGENNKAAPLIRGVTQRPCGRWQAQVFLKGKMRYVGVADTKERAGLLYEIVREKFKALIPDSSRSMEEVDRAFDSARQAALTEIEKDDPLVKQVEKDELVAVESQSTKKDSNE